MLNHTNGCTGYVPMTEDHKRGGYECCLAMQSRLVPNAGDTMTDAAIRMLRNFA